jgi:hypothetical protein
MYTWLGFGKTAEEVALAAIGEALTAAAKTSRER